MMSGHNTICVITALLEAGMVPMTEPTTSFTLEAPSGPIRVEAACKHGKCVSVTLINTPSFAREADLGVKIDVPGGVGEVTLDIAYGGMWYAVVDGPSQLGLQVGGLAGATPGQCCCHGTRLHRTQTQFFLCRRRWSRTKPQSSPALAR